MSDKTLVERLREVNLDCDQHTDCQLANVVGVDCTSATCAQCGMDTAHALADAIEREYLPRPRFEDGDPVQFGDMAEVREDLGDVIEMVFQDDKCVEVGIAFDGGESTSSHYMIYDGERVKRPEPEVLDADGVPIRVGDTVWEVGRRRPLKVTAVEPGIVSYETEDGAHGMYYAIGDLTHKQPDSLERIETDALMASIDYCNKYGLLDSRCNAEEGDEAIRHCTDCGLTCETRMVKHILRRQREVLERDHER